MQFLAGVTQQRAPHVLGQRETATCEPGDERLHRLDVPRALRRE
jgi:hypothetical protein